MVQRLQPDGDAEPSANNPLQMAAFNPQGVPTVGFGWINVTSNATANNTTSGQRNGQLVGRFRW